jgi:hypothetical protein
VAYRIVLRQDLAANWTQNNPVLLSGELGFETDTYRVKLGDGVKRWSLLPYYLRAPYYGHFYDTTFQGVGSTGEAYYIRCNTTNLSNGVYVTGATGGPIGATAGPSGATGNFRFFVENTGTYEIKLSGNLKTCGNGERFVFVWLAQNGVDVPYSAQMVEMSGNVSNPDYADFNYHYPVGASGDDYFEIKYANDLCPLQGFEPVTGGTIGATGGMPNNIFPVSVPSVSVTISQIG